MFRFATCLLLALGSLPAIGAPDDPLRRRADWGASIAPPDATQPPRIVAFRPGSALERAGLRVGDQILELNGRAPGDAISFGARMRALREGDQLQLKVRRGATIAETKATLPAMRLETTAEIEVRYGAAKSDKGYFTRTYTSRPVGAQGKLPLVVFIPWLSCEPVESPFGAPDGWARMLESVKRDSGAQVVRLEKPGLGDSGGPDCTASDLDHDLAAFRAGIRAALADPGADPERLYLFGGSIGGALAPVLAGEFKLRGLIATGGFTRTWFEHMLDIERRRLTLSGKSPVEVNAAMKGFAQFYDLTLRQGLTPAQAIARAPGLGALWYDAPGHQYGRAMRYYQQLQALDVEGAWARMDVPSLILRGDNDWIMGREEAERAVAIVRARDPRLVTYIVRPGMDHHFDAYPTPQAAFDEVGGVYDSGAAADIVRWIRSH